jgi:amidase
MDELAFLPATEQARLVREREVSPIELVELYLERIERLDPELGAFVTVCADEALADAREKAEQSAEAPFHGVPIALKDLDATRGIRTTFSCPAFADNVPDFDLAHVARTRAAGSSCSARRTRPSSGRRRSPTRR